MPARANMLALLVSLGDVDAVIVEGSSE